MFYSGRDVSALQRNCRGVMPLNFLNSTKKYLVFSTPICRAMLSMGWSVYSSRRLASSMRSWLSLSPMETPASVRYCLRR